MSSNNNNNIKSNIQINKSKPIKTIDNTEITETIENTNKIVNSIVSFSKENMFAKTQNPWCAFKNVTADIFIELSKEYNKLTNFKISSINTRSIQTINKLLDLYKDNYPSYKLLFSSEKNISIDLIKNPHNHPLIKTLIKSFSSVDERSSFSNKINSIIDN